MKRILINATHNEEIRVALCKDHHLYDFDLENRTREQKKSNIYKGHVTRVEPSLEAVFVEYGSARQGFLPLREIAPEYLNGNLRGDNIKQLIKEGDELIIQVEKEERGNKGAAVSTFISLAGRYLVLMPNNAKGGGISRQISGKVRDDMRQIISSLDIPKGMSVIVRTAGIGKTYEDLAADLSHLLDIWADILQKNRKESSPYLLYQEAGVVTRAMRDYLRDDIGEIWIDSEHAYNEAASFISQVMPSQMGKLRKYMDFEPMFVRFGIERQIESAYQREVRLPSGGSIVIDQTEALVSIDINSAKSTKGSDVAETAFHTNLEAAEEIARQLRLRDMGGLIVIDFIDMAETKHQKEVEKRLIEATRYDRARVQFAEISKFGLLEMSRQRLRPSLDEATGYICPRCHGNGMIRDLRSLALSIMRQIEQLALKHRSGEVQAEVPTEIAAFLLNEKRESLVYLEQDSGTRITVLPHAHLESPNFSLHFNPDGFAPASYDRIIDTEEQQNIDRGYDVNWQTPEPATKGANHWHKQSGEPTKPKSQPTTEQKQTHTPQAVAWLSNLFAPKQEASLAPSLQSADAAAAIEAIVNTGATSLGALGSISLPTQTKDKKDEKRKPKDDKADNRRADDGRFDKADKQDKRHDLKQDSKSEPKSKDTAKEKEPKDKYPKREAGSRREPRDVIERGVPLVKESDRLQDKPSDKMSDKAPIDSSDKISDKEVKPAESKHDKADKTKETKSDKGDKPTKTKKEGKLVSDDVVVRVAQADKAKTITKTVHLSLDSSNTPAWTNDMDTVTDLPLNTNGQNADNQPVDDPTTTNQVVDNQDTVSMVSQSSVNATPDETLSEQVVVSQEAPKDTPDETPQPTDDVSDLALPVSDLTDTSSPATQPQNGTTTDSQDDSKTKTLTMLMHRLQVNVGAFVAPELPNPEQLQSIARKTGRSQNDPRVVKESFNEQALTGTAGEFVRANLKNADEHIAKHGFIAAFLLATNRRFEFANYGYSALPSSEVEAFLHKIKPNAQIAIVAGKTTPPTLAPSPRAKNDPRGQQVPTASDNATQDTAPKPVAPSSADELSLMLTDITNAIQDLLDVSAILPDNTQQDGKTTPESYKNMIETIAEQLLPQTGFLKLTSPKKPAKKATTKKSTKVAIKVPKVESKPKTEIRKRKTEVVLETEPTESNDR